MAKKTARRKSVKPAGDSSRSVEFYEHKGSKRLNNPQVGLVNTKTEKPESKKSYRYDPHLTPNLAWAGKIERGEFDLSTVSLNVHERVDPRTIIESVKKSPEKIWEQLSLFNKPVNKLSFVKEIEFYKHERDWSNRLIAGDSLLVMNSLIEKEGMASKVQTVYFDPPYGVKYGSNFQPFVNQREVKDGKDSDLTAEPEMLKAFRDTWELGIHSYLSYMRDRLLLSRELLHESGSIFVQISDENSHYLRNILDEVFGAENFISEIQFVKTGGSTSKFIASIADKIIWFAKDKTKAKFHPLYERKVLSETDYDYVEFADRTYRRLSEEEKLNPSLIPAGGKVFALHSLKSSGYRENTTVNFRFEGEVFHPGANNNWKTTLDGMERLAKAGRIKKSGNSIRYVRYLEDFPVNPLTNIWPGAGAANMIYVVQTAEKPIARCILMSSDPGDLVFDPTCGSGTTAAVAEKFGRRWITCDTSRVAVQLAKQRLMTSVFPYFSLRYPDEGVASGFVYQTVPHVTLKSIATLAPSDDETLFDSPLEDSKKIRVTGPFTVEAVPAPVVKDIQPEPTSTQSLNGPDDWVSELRSTGVRLKNGKVLKFARLELLPATKYLQADGSTTDGERVVISFGPDFAPLEQRQVELALQEAERLKPSPTVIVFAAFQFDPEAAMDIDRIEWGGVSVLKVQMNTDLFTEDLRKKRSSNESFWLVGKPDVDVTRITKGKDKGKYQVRVKGFDYYNPKTGSLDSGGADKIAMWMLDTDYDGRSLLPKQVFFPLGGSRGGWTKLAKTLKNEIDEDLIEAYGGTESLPFEIGDNKKIAVKIIDDRGIESMLVEDFDG